jgi:hypothetical protein
MKTVDGFIVLMLFVLSPKIVRGQGSETKPSGAEALPRLCSAGNGTVSPDTVIVNGIYYFCAAANTWAALQTSINHIAVDGVKYPYSVTGVQNCINDAKTLGSAPGICDASGVGSIALGVTELDVGDSSGSRVQLILPVNATWTTAIQDGTSCGIKQFNKTMMVGVTTSGTPGFTLSPASSATNVAALYCTDPSPPGRGSYVIAQGFGVANMTGATMTKAAFLVQHVFDDSVVRDVYVANSSGKGILVADVCCSTTFYNVTSDGFSGKGAVPLIVGDPETGGTIAGGAIDLLFNGGSFDHPGAALNNIQIVDTNGNTGNVTFLNPYMEPNATDTATPLMEVGANVFNLTVIGSNASNSAAGSNAYVIDVATWAGPTQDAFIGIKSQTLHCINDHTTGIIVVSTGSFGQCSSYFSGGIQAYGGNSGFGEISVNGPSGVDIAATDGHEMHTGTLGGKYYLDLGGVIFRDGTGANGGSVTLTGPLKTPNTLISPVAPTISAGFGTGASVIASNGPGAFRIRVGTANIGTGVVALPVATTGWNCQATDITTKSSEQASTLQIGSTAVSATLQNYTDVMHNRKWRDGDVLAVSCFAY